MNWEGITASFSCKEGSWRDMTIARAAAAARSFRMTGPIPTRVQPRSARDAANTGLPYSFCEVVQGRGEETVSLRDEWNDPAGEREFA